FHQLCTVFHGSFPWAINIEKIMKHSYRISGMGCNGCKVHVEATLSKVEGVKGVSVDLEHGEAAIEMETHIPLETLQEAMAKDGGGYGIDTLDHQDHAHTDHSHSHKEAPKGQGTGIFYCPMQCEGDKTYDAPGDCPVCGMDLVEEQNLSTSSQEQWSCPMHPEVLQDHPGDCPICGMDLVPLAPEPSSEEKTYRKLAKKFWIALAFTLPIFLIAMSEMIPNNPLYDLMDQKYWNWV